MKTAPDTAMRRAVCAADKPEALLRIHEAGVELALWRRRLSADLSQWLHELPASQLPHLHARLSAVESVQALHAACDAAGSPAGLQRDAWVDDASALVHRFARLTRSATLRLRLESIDNDACRRLHRDCVALRLLTTYRGPGTRWVDPEHALQALASPDDYDGPLNHLNAGDVALFKGCGFPGQPHDGGIVHRSPRIAGGGITRLVLCIDPSPGGLR